MEEGQDEGESLGCDPSWLLSIRSIKTYLYFQNRPSCCMTAAFEDENTVQKSITSFRKGD